MGHVSHGLAKLGAGASRMAKGESKRALTTQTLSVRLPITKADRIKAKAAAAGMSAGAYIAMKLRDTDHDNRSDIAALALLMRIAAAAEGRSRSSPANIDGSATAAVPALSDEQVQRMIDALCGSVAAHIGAHDIPPLEELEHLRGRHDR